MPAVTDAQGFHHIEREWGEGATRLTLTLPMQIRASKGVTAANGWNDTTTPGVNPTTPPTPGVNPTTPPTPGVGRSPPKKLGAGHMNVTAGLGFCTVEYGEG